MQGKSRTPWQLTLTDTPPASLGTPSFAIQGIKGADSVAVGSEITLSVEVSSQGAAGTAYLSSSSENNQVAIVAPETQNVTIGGTNTEGSLSQSQVTAGNTTISSLSNGEGQSQNCARVHGITSHWVFKWSMRHQLQPSQSSTSGIPLLDVVVGAVHSSSLQ